MYIEYNNVDYRTIFQSLFESVLKALNECFLSFFHHTTKFSEDLLKPAL